MKLKIKNLFKNREGISARVYLKETNMKSVKLFLPQILCSFWLSSWFLNHFTGEATTTTLNCNRRENWKMGTKPKTKYKLASRHSTFFLTTFSASTALYTTALLIYLQNYTVGVNQLLLYCFFFLFHYIFNFFSFKTSYL